MVETLADEVDWIFMGMCPEALKPFVHESHGFEIDFSAYPKALASLDLDLAIARLHENIVADELAIKRLKKRKLWLKDCISRLESALIPDEPA